MLRRIMILLMVCQPIFSKGGWILTYGRDEVDGSNSILQRPDGGYILMGYTRSFGNGGHDIWLISTGPDGKKEWAEFYGGSGSDVGYSIISAQDSGYIILGETYSYGSGLSDILLMKTDHRGKQQWTRTFGGEGLEKGFSIQATTDGGYIIAGMTTSSGKGREDAWIIKTDHRGREQWTRTFGGPKSDGVRSVRQTRDGGYIITGYTWSFVVTGVKEKKPGFFAKIFKAIFKKKTKEEAWLIKINAQGEREWHRTYGGKKNESGRGVLQTSDGGYIIAGKTNTFGAGNDDIWLLRIGPKGKEEWSTTFGEKGNEYANSLIETGDGDFIIAGYKEPQMGFFSRLSRKKRKNSDVLLIKADQKGNRVWTRTFGGDAEDEGMGVVETIDGGLALTGHRSTEPNGWGDAWLIKTDEYGEKDWDQTYGGRGSDGGYSVQQTSTGGYILAGYTNSYGSGADDLWLIKTNFHGERVWSRVFGGGQNDYGRSVKETEDGGYIIAGETNSFGSGNYDVYLVRVDTAGNRLWDKTFGGLGDDIGYEVVGSADGGYVIAGHTRSYGRGGDDAWLIKTGPKGKKEWSRFYGGSGYDNARSVQQTTDGGYILTGGTTSYGSGNTDVWLVKVGPNGKKKWDKTFGGHKADSGYMVRQTMDGGYIIVGETSSFGSRGNSDVLLVKADSLGNKVWQRSFGGKETDIGYSVSQTSDGGYIVTGETSSFGNGNNDIWLVRVGPGGNKVWSKTFGGKGVDRGHSVQQELGGGFLMAGVSTISEFSYDAILILTEPNGKTEKYEP